AALAGEHLLRGGGELEQPFAVREPALLRPERIRLPRLRRDRPDLVDLVAQQIELTFPVAGLILEASKGTPCRGRTPVRLTIGSDGGHVLGARVAIEEGRLGGWIQEPERAMLPVELDQPAAEIAQGRRGGQLPADAGAALAVSPHAASEDDLAILDPVRRHIVRAGCRDRRPPSVGYVEPSLN